MSANRMLNYGFENISDPTMDWAHEAQLLSKAGINGVGLSVGRVEWSAFAQQSLPGRHPAVVSENDYDLVRHAIAELKSAGFAGEVVLSIDALVPSLLTKQPELAGVDATGEASDSFASAWALTRGPVGESLVRFATEVAVRYKPAFIGLTELMIAEFSFGEQDLTLYCQAMGTTDWPRLGNGSIDTTDPTLGMWRSLEMASLVARVRRAVSRHGVLLEMDVRAPLPGELRGRPDSGHDYGMLLEAADRLAIWHYVGIDEHSRGAGQQHLLSLIRHNAQRMVLSVGLWANEGTLSAGELITELALGADLAQLSVTPASLMSSAHWKALQRHRRTD